MNSARIDIFVTPLREISQLKIEHNDFEKSRGIYIPPSHECDIISKLQNDGYTLTINSNCPCSRSAANNVCGWAIVIDEGTHFIKAKDYEDGNIFCLLWFQNEIDDIDLYIVKKYFGHYFGGYYGNVEVPERLFGCVKPIEISKAIGGSFIEDCNSVNSDITMEA